MTEETENEKIKRLEQSAFDLWPHHELPVFQGDGNIAKCQFAVFDRNEIFPVNGFQQGQYAAIEYFPGSNLLLHHVEARAFKIHAHCSGLRPVIDLIQTLKNKASGSLHQEKECVFRRQGLSAISHAPARQARERIRHEFR